MTVTPTRPAGTAVRSHPSRPGSPAGNDAPLPDPGPWAGALVRSTIEVLCGTRPLGQLTRWLSPELYELVAQRTGSPPRRRRPRPVMVRRVHVCRISPEIVEAAVTVHDGAHLRAAAVRLEAHRGRWRATALQIG